MERVLSSAQLGSIKSKHQTYVVNMGISCESLGNRKQPGQVDPGCVSSKWQEMPQKRGPSKDLRGGYVQTWKILGP